jgi:hypothetical protein
LGEKIVISNSGGASGVGARAKHNQSSKINDE